MSSIYEIVKMPDNLVTLTLFYSVTNYVAYNNTMSNECQSVRSGLTPKQTEER